MLEQKCEKGLRDMYCPKCGKELIPDTRFCTNCGIDVPKAIDDLSTKAANVETEKMVPTKAASTAKRHDPATKETMIRILYLLFASGVVLCMAVAFNMDLAQIVGWAMIGLLAWWFIKPYVMIAYLNEKNHAGIRTSLTQDQIVALLEEHPWCDDQLVRNDDSEIPRSQHRAQIYFRGIRAQIYFFIENGVLHAYGSSAVKIQKFRRLYLAGKETGNVLQYVTELEKGNIDAAERLRKKNAIAIKMRSWYDTLDQLCWLLVVVLVVGSMIYSSQKRPIHDLKDIVFDDYGTLTLGDAVEETMRNVEWTQEKISKTHYKVTLSGFLPEEYANISLVFDVNYADNHVYAHTESVVWNDEAYSNGFMVSYALDTIYGD